MISGELAGGGFTLPQLHPLLLFLIGVILTGIGIFAGLEVAIALAIAAIIIGLYDMISNILAVSNNPNLTQDQKDLVYRVYAWLFALGAGIALIGIIAGSTIAFVALAVYVCFITIVASMFIDWIIKIASKTEEAFYRGREQCVG